MTNEERSTKSAVEFVEEWQTGFFLIIGSAVGGFATAIVFASFLEAPNNMVGFFSGAILTFVALSYLFYGTGT